MIRYKKDTDNIVTLSLDMATRNVNIINPKLGDAFLPVLEHLKKEKGMGQLKGVIITSDKKTFLTGGDLEYLGDARNAEEVFQLSRKLQQFYRELERPGVPVVAAMNGTALGIGFELALACHYRIVLDHQKIRLGHPEIGLGMMPGHGGVIRLMWLLGIEKAFPILTNGLRYAPKKALEVGIVDALAKSPKEMMEKAKKWILANQNYRRPWDNVNHKIKEGTARDPKVAKVIQTYSAQLAKDTHNNFPAPQAILNTLAEGSLVDFDTACRIEARYFTKVLMGSVSKNMTKAFWYDFNEIKAGRCRPKGFGRFRPKKVGIVGAGKMGSGIAFTCLIQGMEVVLKDVSKSVAARGREYVDIRLDELVKNGKISQADKKKALERVIVTETTEEFETCDLVIEAVFENENVKSKVIRESEERMDEYALLASNTLSIPISRLAKSSSRPENFVGMHFFLPADKVPLVEIVRGKATSDETIARAFDFVKAIRKTPIVVKDNWGFYVARVKNTYILEGISLLQEGYPPALIENLGVQAGMPKGALAMADELSMSFVMKYELQAAEHYGAKYIQHPAVVVCQRMQEELERPGKSKKAGFYDYNSDGVISIWSELTNHFETTKEGFSRKRITERLLFAQVLEAVWCLQEGIVKTVAEANLGSIHGWGFPSFKGGVMQFIQDYGRSEFIEQCKVYEKRYGPRFKVPKMLLKKN